MDRALKAGILFPEILVPEEKINKKKWAVIACDQFTSNPDYWARTTRAVGGSPSTLHIMLPEAYLRAADAEERIAHAKETMMSYISDGVLVKLPAGAILVERETPFGTRVGMMLAVDLEQYDWDPDKKPLIRATEQTVMERVPPRMRLRKGAMIECPHIMLLINDPKDSVLSPVYQARSSCAMVYDTGLLQDGGHIKGWFVDDEKLLSGVVDALLALKEKAEEGMLFAVGDGNHSLASAKAVWEEKKKGLSEEERETDPLRYALCEMVNLYDNGITLHPIHRILFGVEPSAALRSLVTILNGMGADARMMYTRGARSIAREGMQIIQFESKMAKGRIEICRPVHALVSMTLTAALDKLMEELPRAEIDYIHGDEEFHEHAKEHGNLGFLMEPMTKDQIFDAVIDYGVLPRKAFSLGQAVEKRYYYECRLIVDLKPAAQAQAQPEDAPAAPVEPSAVRVEPSAVPVEPLEASAFAPEAQEDAAQQGGALQDEAEYGDQAPRKPKRGLFGRRKDR
jgi:hypothetical protein